MLFFLILGGRGKEDIGKEAASSATKVWNKEISGYREAPAYGLRIIVMVAITPTAWPHCLVMAMLPHSQLLKTSVATAQRISARFGWQLQATG
jgi:hypothetical protein